MALTFLFGFLLQNTSTQVLLASTLPHHFSTETNECNDFIKINGSTNLNHFHFIQEIATNTYQERSALT